MTVLPLAEGRRSASTAPTTTPNRPGLLAVPPGQGGATPNAGPVNVGRTGLRDNRDDSYARLAAQQRRRRERDTSERTYPGDPWQVEDGMPPVITPPEGRSHDPGPGTVGINK
jgi:hypothetical protein